MARKKFVMTTISGNEERWVKGWCKSVMKANPDLVIVNLTQYDDNSEALFKAGIPEDKLIFLKNPWQKSFSEARNHTLAEVPDDTDYVMFVDLDEVITESSYAELEKFLHADLIENDQVMVNIYNSVNQKSMVASLFYPRLFPWRNKAGVKLNPLFDGEVHNQLVYPKNVQISATRSQISLFHYGYALDDKSMAKKHARSEELIRQQIAEDADNYFAYLNLAQLLRAKGDLAGTVEAANKSIDIVSGKIHDGDTRYRHAYIMAQEQLATVALQTQSFDEAIDASDKALKIKPDHLDSIINLANAYMYKQELEKAKFWFKRFLFVRARYDETKDNTNLILNHLNSSFVALYHLGTINAFQGNLEESLGYFKRCYEQEPTFADIGVKYIDILRKLGKDNEVAELAHNFIHNHAEKAFMLYEYFGDVSIIDCNIENAKFNYYQAANLSEGQTDEQRIKAKFESITSAFGEVAITFFETADVYNQMKNRVT